MIISKKTYSYFLESCGGIILGLIIAVIIFSFNPLFDNWKDCIKAFPAIGMCAFGFLLTFLAIILQGNNETITWIKNSKKIYPRFISFNKRIVIVAIFLSLYSYSLGFLNFEWLKTIFNFSDDVKIILQQILISLFGGLITWFVHDTIRFIIIFYLLIKGNQ